MGSNRSKKKIIIYFIIYFKFLFLKYFDMKYLDSSLDDLIKYERERKKKIKLSVEKNREGSLKVTDKNKSIVESSVHSRFSAHPDSKKKKKENGKKWKHDKFTKLISEKDSRNSKRVTTTKISNDGPAPKCIFVSNLGDNVSKDDLQELFGSVGPLKKCFLRLNNRGRTSGTAYIVFENEKDAHRAFVSYSEAKLDGRPMVLELRTGITF